MYLVNFVCFHIHHQGGESKGNIPEEPTFTRATFQGAHTQGLGK